MVPKGANPKRVTFLVRAWKSSCDLTYGTTGRYAGLGAMGVSVEGAHRSDLEMKSTSATEYTLQYKPHEPGIYLLNIKFGDDHVTGTRSCS